MVRIYETEERTRLDLERPVKKRLKWRRYGETPNPDNSRITQMRGKVKNLEREPARHPERRPWRIQEG